MKSCKRNVVGLEESDEPGSENGTQGPGSDQLQGLRKRQRSPDNSSSLLQHSKKAHHDDETTAAGHGVAASAAAATASAFPDHHLSAEPTGEDSPTAAADPPGSGAATAASADGSGAAQLTARNSSRQRGMKKVETLSSQPSASSSKAKKGGPKNLTTQQAKDMVQAVWGASQFSDHMGAGYGEQLCDDEYDDGSGGGFHEDFSDDRAGMLGVMLATEFSDHKPEVGNTANVPEGEAAIGWGVWVAFENKGSLQWFRGVIVDYHWTSKKSTYQIAFEDGTTDKPSVADVAADVITGEFAFREVREYSSEMLRPLHREKCKSRTEEVHRALAQLSELADKKAAELEAFVERTRVLVGPIEPSGDAVRDKAVALLAAVMYPPVAVSPFKAAADLERLLAEKHGNGRATVQDVFDMTCSKLGFDQQRDK
eukprot:gene12674-12801_t